MEVSILIIENEQTIGNLLQSMLKEHKVDVASDGEEGMKLFRMGHYGMVITDLGMAGISGLEVADRIKKINPHIPVVLLTSWGITEESPMFRESNADLLLKKPF